MNDIQQHLLRKIREAADDYRAANQEIAAELVDAVLGATAAGLTRDEIVSDIATGLMNARTR